MTEIPYRKAVGEFNTLVDKQLEFLTFMDWVFLYRQ